MTIEVTALDHLQSVAFIAYKALRTNQCVQMRSVQSIVYKCVAYKAVHTEQCVKSSAYKAVRTKYCPHSVAYILPHMN